MKPIKAEVRPFPAQVPAWHALQDNVTREVVYGGAAGGGKTRLGCEWLISNCIRYPGTRWMMGRKELKKLKLTTLVTFEEICGEWNISKKRGDYHINFQSGEIKFWNGSVIIMWDLKHNPSDPMYKELGSLELTGAFIDEAAEIEREAKVILMSRIRFRLDEFNLVPKLLLTCNPDNGWMFHEYYMPWKENILSNRVKFVRALPGDNPKLPKSYLEELDNLDPVSRMRLRDGIWEYDNDPTTLITYDDIRFLFNNYRILLTNDSNDIVATRTAEKDYNDAWITVDVARKGKDSTCVIRWVGLAAVEIHLFKKETTDVTSQFVNDMMMVYGIPARNVIVDAGGVGGGFCDQVKGCREFVFNGTPIHRDNYKYIKDQMYFALANEITKRNMFVKLPDGEMKTWLMDELAQVKQDNFGKEGKLSVVPKDEVKKKLNGRSPDIADALMLRMLPVVEKRKPFRRADTIAIIEW